MSFIEIKSIYEKAEDKQRFHEAGALLSDIAKNKTNVEVIAKSISEYLKQNPKEIHNGKPN